jgi:hypothetical protein
VRDPIVPESGFPFANGHTKLWFPIGGSAESADRTVRVSVILPERLLRGIDEGQERLRPCPALRRRLSWKLTKVDRKRLAGMTRHLSGRRYRAKLSLVEEV